MLKMEVDAINVPITTAGSTFTKVTFRQAYDVVPIVFTLPTVAGVDPAGLRIRNVTTTDFEIAIVEPGAEDGVHGAAMSTAYLAIEPGRLDFASGLSIEAGRHNTSRAVNGTGSGNVGNPKFGANVTAFDTMNFAGGTFGSTPAVLAEIQTMNSETGAVPTAPSSPWLTASVKTISPTNVQLALDRAEVNDGTVLAEDIGYMAITQGAGNMSDLTNSDVNVLFDALISPDNIEGWDNNSNNGSNGNGDITNFNQTFASNPLVIASLAKRDGGDGGWLARGTITPTSVNFTANEDQWSDDERGHTTEAASLMAFSSGFDTTLNTVPEPSSMAVVTLAMAGLIRRRKRK
jgi:MSHA biogenesis protein MshQ